VLPKKEVIKTGDSTPAGINEDEFLSIGYV
jgi:hypothetical protein